MIVQTTMSMMKERGRQRPREIQRQIDREASVQKQTDGVAGREIGDIRDWKGVLLKSAVLTEI